MSLRAYCRTSTCMTCRALAVWLTCIKVPSVGTLCSTRTTHRRRSCLGVCLSACLPVWMLQLHCCSASQCVDWRLAGRTGRRSSSVLMCVCVCVCVCICGNSQYDGCDVTSERGPVRGVLSRLLVPTQYHTPPALSAFALSSTSHTTHHTPHTTRLVLCCSSPIRCEQHGSFVGIERSVS
jgi:hypothetical protein